MLAARLASHGEMTPPDMPDCGGMEKLSRGKSLSEEGQQLLLHGTLV